MKALEATQALTVQHRVIEGLFEELAHETRRRALRGLVARLAEDLIAHIAAEETVFYPAVRRLRVELARNCDEDLLLRIELRRVLEANVGDACFVEGVAGLRRRFAQHVHDEEKALFPLVSKEMPQAQLEALGVRILASRPPVWVVTSEHGPSGSRGFDAAQRSIERGSDFGGLTLALPKQEALAMAEPHSPSTLASSES